MANVKISALPQLYPIDINDFVAIVENSDSTTKQITQEKLFGGTGHTFNVSSLDNSMIFGGRDNIITSNGGSLIRSSVIVGGKDNSIGGAFNTIGDLQYSGIFAGDNNNINGGGESKGQTIIGGANNQILDGGFLSTIAGGQNNTISMQKGFLGGGDGNNLNSGYEGAIVGGGGNTINSGEKNFIAASNSSNMNNYPIRNFILGTEGGNISSARFSSIMGGYGSNINSGANFQSIINSNAQITASSERNMLINCANGNILGSVGESSLISSSNLNINGSVQNVSVLNCKPTNAEDLQTVSNATYIGISSTITGNNQYTGTTHTESLHVYNQFSHEIIDGGNVSGVVSVNLNAGSVYKFTLVGTITSLDFTGWREGGDYKFWVTSTGNFNINAATIDGSGDVLAQGGAINPTNSGFTKYTGTVIDGNMILNEELDFQVV
jgi:hypothetical protein